MSTPSSAVDVPASKHLSPEQWVEEFEAGWRAEHGPGAFAEHFCRLISPDVRLVQPQLPPVRGHAAFRDSFVKPTFALIPDIHGEVERWAASEDGRTIFIELTLRGTVGRRQISLRACDRLSMRDGVAVERESYFDPGPLIAALARTPRAWPPLIRVQIERLRSALRQRAGQ